MLDEELIGLTIGVSVRAVQSAIKAFVDDKSLIVGRGFDGPGNRNGYRIPGDLLAEISQNGRYR